MNNGIFRVIQEGTSLMGNKYLNEAMVRTWLEYSLKMLDLVCGNTFIKYQYSSFAIQVMNSPIEPFEKLGKCVEYLIKVASMI